MKFRPILLSIKPGVSKKNLLFIAALMWTFAGGMLLYRGIRMLVDYKRAEGLRIIISLIGGAVFYYFMFSKISLKHTNRILHLPYEKPCAFSFFNGRSYFMMILMITMGISLRRFNLVPPEFLSVLYVTMGIPLALSALRFYYTGIFYPQNG